MQGKDVGIGRLGLEVLVNVPHGDEGVHLSHSFPRTSMTAVLPGVWPTSQRLTEMNMSGTVTWPQPVRMGMVSGWRCRR